MMRVLVTGADGFVGRSLVRALARRSPGPAEIVATDRRFTAPADLPGVVERIADLADPAAITSLCAPGFDLVFHLASQPGAAAERAPDGGRAINRDSTLALIEAVVRSSASGSIPRFVLASSIAVYGPLGPGPASEDAPCRPALSYGAHKLIGEIELADRTRRGDLIGASLRLPGIVARPAEESGHGSAFMSRIFHAAFDASPYECPVGPAARCWWMSVDRAVDNLLHAGRLEAEVARTRQAWQVPVLAETLGSVLDALTRRWGSSSTAGIRFAPDPAIETLFGTMPDLSAPASLAAGFCHDGSLDDLVGRIAASRSSV